MYICSDIYWLWKNCLDGMNVYFDYFCHIFPPWHNKSQGKYSLSRFVKQMSPRIFLIQIPLYVYTKKISVFSKRKQFCFLFIITFSDFKMLWYYRCARKYSTIIISFFIFSSQCPFTITSYEFSMWICSKVIQITFL